MNELHDIIWSLLVSEDGVKLPKLIKEVYLVDWKCAFAYPPRPCNFIWTYGPCGPTSNEIIDCIRHHSDLFIVKEKNYCGGAQELIIYRANVEHEVSLSSEVQSAISLVLNVAASKDSASFSLLVSSTYPLMRSSMLDELDIEKFAHEYREVLKNRIVPNA